MNVAQRVVLITGIHGFTGRYMAAEMKSNGYRVVGIGSRPNRDVDYYQADLTDRARVYEVLEAIRPNVIIHLAAVAFVAHGDADAFYRVNLLGTRNLLEAAAEIKPPEAILLASSANVYGNASIGVLREDTRPDPANDYAVSKLSMEFMARLWMEKLPIVIARPFNYTGVGQADNFLLPKIVAHYRSNARQIELGNIDVWRDFSDVRAMVEAYRRLCEVDTAGKVVNVCSGSAHSVREILDMCAKITGRALPIAINDEYVRPNEVKKLWGDSSLLRSLIGDWRTPKLIETLNWMLTS
ncbi:GDP-mannose 4,6-dehydratase [Paracandidimonas lactea]|uniref:GDP-mannose 4,6-dehydratase n=1 Tax=Paracandidimonas lactea TaxID=2895524 RepID=UPI001F2AAC9F|nr:GDP-mannose 4,6-dehydratase [Paracandidimonas lactea]